MISTDARITIEVRPLRANALRFIRDNFESRANVTDDSDSHDRKQPSQITSTDDARTIDLKPLPRNAILSMPDYLESVSN
jgi:hypothetical protein